MAGTRARSLAPGAFRGEGDGGERTLRHRIQRLCVARRKAKWGELRGKSAQPLGHQRTFTGPIGNAHLRIAALEVHGTVVTRRDHAQGDATVDADRFKQVEPGIVKIA